MDPNTLEAPLLQDNFHHPTTNNYDPMTEAIANLKPKNIEVKNCCCFHIAYFPEAQMTLCNHWILSPVKPIIIALIFILFYCSEIYQIIEYSKDSSNRLYAWIAVGVISVVFLFLVVSYFGIIIRGPGYLPYNYSYTHKKKLDWKEVINTFAVYKEQADFARRNPRPPRSSFSVTARRFVLRADHFCLWTESWVGLNNYRYFLLMTFYAFLFSVLYICSLHWWAVHFFTPRPLNLKDAKKIICIIVPIFESILLIIVGCMAIFYFTRAFYNLVINATGIELYKGLPNNKSPYNKGCCNNFTEICGPKYCCLLWWIPIFCFNPTVDGLYNEQTSLIENA